MSCGRKLADSEWFKFCGETDMGQTMPALCTECGGSYLLAPDTKQTANTEEKSNVIPFPRRKLPTIYTTSSERSVWKEEILSKAKFVETLTLK